MGTPGWLLKTAVWRISHLDSAVSAVSYLHFTTWYHIRFSRKSDSLLTQARRAGCAVSPARRGFSRFFRLALALPVLGMWSSLLSRIWLLPELEHKRFVCARLFGTAFEGLDFVSAYGVDGIWYSGCNVHEPIPGEQDEEKERQQGRYRRRLRIDCRLSK